MEAYTLGQIVDLRNAPAIIKDKLHSTMMLQEFIRMLDGKVELGEVLCFGVKTLRDTFYFKTERKVDYENWWKEFSSFVAAPIKRTTSSASALRSNTGNYSKPKVQKQLSMPATAHLTASNRHSRTSSISSVQSDSDKQQMETLRNQVSKLEEENSKLSKAEEQRRKLELEVNYWKEYVTNSQAFKRSGVTVDTANELATSRSEFLQLQDEFNETQKKLKLNTGKLLMQNKELAMTKEKLQEANSIIAVHKAKIEQLNKDLLTKTEVKEKEKGLIIPAASNELFFSGENDKTPSGNVTRPSAADVMSSDGQHLEDKFLVLKDRLKRIERELFLKSKELEKANESRSKVAKYTRSLLQELELRLSDNQQKLTETEEKLKNVNTELVMERERRIKLEEGPRRRMSSVVAPPKPQPTDPNSFDSQSPPSDLSEHDADTKYADYYRSRFKEAESSLLEKDKKLHQVEEKVKELQNALKSNSDSYKVINELQTKLSDATHKLSDRQLKIHELTREIDRLKEFEKTYTKKSKRCDTLEDIVKDLEKTNSDQSKNLHQVKQELEMMKIREVVLKEQLQTFVEDSENSEEDDDDVDIGQLCKSVDLKKKIECMIELEALSKKLAIDNEKLAVKNSDLEARVKHLNMESFKTIEAKKALSDNESIITNDQQLEYEKRIKELEKNLSEAEEKYCNEITKSKDKQYNEMAIMEKKYDEESKQVRKELINAKKEIENLLKYKIENEDDFNELRGKLTMAEIKIADLQQSLSEEISSRENTEVLLQEKSSSLSEMEEHCNQVTSERDSLKEEQESKRSSYLSVDDDDESDGKYDHLNTENHGLKMKVRQLERQLRLSSEKFEDVMSSLREKGSLLDSGKHDRDSGIVITQEIRSIIDAYNINFGDVTDKPLLREESDDIFVTPKSSFSSEPESIEKYKKMCVTYEIHIKDLSKRLLTSEEKVLELAEELEQHANTEEDYVSKYNTLVVRIEDLQTQIMESQESLQSKADELERERKNVINLVEVTSAYIKELEGSLAESKSKAQEQAELKKGHRPSPEGGTGVHENDNNKEDLSVEQKLTAKVLMLQSDMLEMKAGHQAELERIHAETQKEVAALRRQSLSAGVSEESEELITQIQKLEGELEKQHEIYEKDVALLQKQFQAELKTAFNGDNSSMDMLHRIQELEMEIEETRKECDSKVKECQETYEKEKEQMKDDMATVLQATLSATDFGRCEEPQSQNENIILLEEQVIQLEQELVNNKQQYEEELEMEKEAHCSEMEDTIRDMMILRDATNSSRYDDRDESDGGSSSRHGSFREPDPKLNRSFSVEEVENIKAEYEQTLEAQVEEHEEELQQVRQDMALVIASLKQGNYSDTILELQAKIKELESEIDDMKSAFKKERSSYEMKLKRGDSANFFAMRRNEEMGSKIYQMQIELEEIDRKHQVELQAYIDKLGGDDGDNVNVSLKMNEELQEKNRELEKSLDELRASRDDEMEAFSMKLRNEKREAIEEMTDKVLKLEALIDDMKKRHEQDVKQYERLDRSENLEASTKESERVKELEIVCENLKEEYEEEIEELSKEHTKEVEKLRLFYEKEIGEMKKRSSSDVDGTTTSPSSRKSSVDQSSVTRQLKEQKEKHDQEIKNLKARNSEEKENLMNSQQKDIEDIRIQYDEKLKMSYKEGLRRHSVSERKSDATKMRELIAEKEGVQAKLLDLEIKYDSDTGKLNEKIRILQKIVSDLKGGYEQGPTAELSKQTLDTLADNESQLEDESQKKLKEIQEQIERYERRIEYYREKSQRENTEESHRVSELQSEIVDLHQEIDEIKKSKRKESHVGERRGKTANSKSLPRRNTDGTPSNRRHTDTDVRVRRDRDPKKRWSNLEERSEVIARSIAELDGKRNPKLATLLKKDEGKSGTVLARKTLWENITVDDTSKSKSVLAKTQSVK